MKNKKPWIIVAACCGLICGSIGFSINCSGVFYSIVAEDLGVGRGAFALHMTIFNLVTAFGSFLVPRLMNQIKYKMILYGAVGAAVVSTFLMGRVSSIPLFYLLGAIRGLSTCMFSVVPATMIINQWFVKSHGTATSIVLSASGIGGAIGSILISRVINSAGWRMGYTVLSIGILVLALPALLIPFEISPDLENALPYGGTKKVEIKPQPKEKYHINILQGSFIALMVVAFMMTFVTMLGQHFPGYAQSLGFLSTGAVMTSAGMIGNISFKVIIGILADKLGAAKATLTMMAISTIGIVMIIFIKNPFVLIASAFLYGACYSVAAVSLPLLTRYFFDIELYNTVFPYANAIGNIGGAIAMSAIGFVYDIFQSYTIAFLISIGFVAVSFAILLLNMHNKQVRVPHHTS